MSISRGKEFENKLIESFKSIPDADVRRLKDQQSFFKGSSNDCDLLVYHWPTLFVFEAKSFHGDRFPLSNISEKQFLGMLERSEKQGVIAGFVIWAIDYKKVYFVYVDYIRHLLNNNYKSILMADLLYIIKSGTKEIIEYKSTTKKIYPEFINPVEFLREIRWRR